jgi:hypothetical protein
MHKAASSSHSEPPHSTLVSDWFGADFSSLHPLLQHLHRYGGQLAGEIKIRIPSGFAGYIGRRLAKKLDIPATGEDHALRVQISHTDDGLHWDRRFDNQTSMLSILRPIGTRPTGYWIESTGPLQLFVAVDIIDGGWHWRCIKIQAFGIRLPLFLFPASQAFKKIENDKYRFFVGFSLPVLGQILSYGGLLHLQASAAAIAHTP